MSPIKIREHFGPTYFDFDGFRAVIEPLLWSSHPGKQTKAEQCGSGTAVASDGN